MAPRSVRRLSVWFGEPHFVASVAAAAIDEEGRILLCNHVFRRGAPWGMPGGFLMKGEDPADAIRRELKEELGVEPVELELLLVRTFPKTRQLEIIYRCRIEGEPSVDSVEVREAEWFSPDALPPMTGDQKQLIGKALPEQIVSCSAQERRIPTPRDSAPI